MKVDGGCHCRAIRYEAEIDPDEVLICHCTDCQTLSGSAFRTIAVTRPNTFRLLAGTPKVYEKRADSGNVRQQTFCADCGSPVYSAPGDGSTTVVVLRVGTLRQRAELVPRDQYWFRSALGWLARLPAISRQPRQPPAPG